MRPLARPARSSPWSLALAAALACAPRFARADAPPSSGASNAAPRPRRASARFAWVRAVGAESCPDERAVARRVALRMGQRPFSEGAAHSIEALVAPDEDAFVLRILLRDADGALLGERVLHSDTGNCASLLGPATLAVALAIDPDATLRPPLTPAAEEAALAAADASADTPAPHAPPVREEPRAPVHAPPRAELTELRALLTAGMLPQVSLGLALSAGVPITERFHLRLGSMVLPEVRTGDQRFAFGLFSLRAAACGHLTFARDVVALDLCGGLHAGALHAVVFRPTPTEPGDRPWVALETHARLSLRLVGPLRASVSLEGLVPFVRYAFAIEEPASVVFQQTPVTLLLGLGLGLAFF